MAHAAIARQEARKKAKAQRRAARKAAYKAAEREAAQGKAAEVSTVLCFALTCLSP